MARALRYLGLLVAAAVLFTLFAGHGVAGENVLVVDSFSGKTSQGGLPEGWTSLVFSRLKKLTTYMPLKQEKGYVLKASSTEAASALFKKMTVDLKEFPILSWRWKVRGVLARGNALTRQGDDFAARVYVAFEFIPEKASYYDRIRHATLKTLYGDYVPGTAITYIWANRIEKGTAVPNQFLAESMMVAVESGGELANRWVVEQRNVYQDYKKLFKEEPPKVIGIIIMTDTDNTKGRATAYYDDIVFKKAAHGRMASVPKAMRVLPDGQ